MIHGSKKRFNRRYLQEDHKHLGLRESFAFDSWGLFKQISWKSKEMPRWIHFPNQLSQHCRPTSLDAGLQGEFSSHSTNKQKQTRQVLVARRIKESFRASLVIDGFTLREIGVSSLNMIQHGRHPNRSSFVSLLSPLLNERKKQIKLGNSSHWRLSCSAKAPWKERPSSEADLLQSPWMTLCHWKLYTHLLLRSKNREIGLHCCVVLKAVYEREQRMQTADKAKYFRRSSQA